MTTSKFCIQQRQQERRRLKKLLAFGFAGSALLHGILVYAFPRWTFESTKLAENPMEITIVDKPEPKPQPQPKPVVEQPKPKSAVEQPKPEPQPQPVVKKPEPQPEPAPPVKPPEPIKTETTPPKPKPKEVLTSPTPAPTPAVASAPVKEKTQPAALSNSSNETNSVSEPSSSSKPDAPDIATGSSAPPPPESGGSEGISCISNCQPEYPASLEGAEGSAEIKLTVDANGNTIGATIVSANSNNQLNRQALLATRKMKFSSSDSSASVRVTVNFTVAGSEYDRVAREAQERQKREAAARQQQQELEQQARQERIERERQVETQQRSQPQPQTTPKPLPQPSENDVDAQMLQKFRDRIERYRVNE